MKKLIKVVLVLVVLIVVLVVGGVLFAFSRIDAIARQAIEAGGTYALGAQTTLDKADVGIRSGTFAMSGLKVANPAPPSGAEAWKAPHFLTLGDGGVAVDLDTLQQDLIELPKLGMSDFDVRLERHGDISNYGVILANLKKLSGDGGKPQPDTGSERKFVVKELELKNITVTLDMFSNAAVVGELTKVTVPIDSIVLKDIGAPGTQSGGIQKTGVTLKDLTSIIVQAILGAAAEKGAGVIPGDILGDLKGSLANLDGLKNLQMQVQAQAQAKIEEIGKKAQEQVQKGIEDAKKKAEDALKKGLDGLLPGKKDEKK
jgi:hypothetical protein